MSLKDDAYYRDKIYHSDNIYQELTTLMKSARQLADSVGNHILHSQALTSIIQDKPIDKNVVNWRYNKFNNNEVNEFLSDIDDVDVSNAVYDSIHISNEKRHLIYRYNNISDEGRRARIRILTRMLYDNLRNVK